MSSRYDMVDVIVEIVVGEDFLEDSTITSFKHKRSKDELNFGVVGSWLIDMEDEVEFPREIGRYRMNAEWNEDLGLIDSIYDIEKLDIE